MDRSLVADSTAIRAWVGRREPIQVVYKIKRQNHQVIYFLEYSTLERLTEFLLHKRLALNHL